MVRSRLTEENGKTTLTLRGGPVNAANEEIAAYEQMRPMTAQGFQGTFDQLAEYLNSQK